MCLRMSFLATGWKNVLAFPEVVSSSHPLPRQTSYDYVFVILLSELRGWSGVSASNLNQLNHLTY